MYRAFLVWPFASTVIGSAAGICWAMIFRQEVQERAHVYLDDSVPCLIRGGVAGCLFGFLVCAICARWPRLLPAAAVLAATLLRIGIMAPLGWFAGDMAAYRQTREGMAIGAAASAGIGFLIGVAQVLLDLRGRRTAAGPVSDPHRR